MHGWAGSIFSLVIDTVIIFTAFLYRIEYIIESTIPIPGGTFIAHYYNFNYNTDKEFGCYICFLRYFCCPSECHYLPGSKMCEIGIYFRRGGRHMRDSQSSSNDCISS